MPRPVPAGRTARLLRRLTILWLAAALAMLGTTPALASHEPPRLSLTVVEHAGPYFDLRLDPGESVELAVEITTAGHDSVLARMYVADVYSLINGGFGAELGGEVTSGPSTWVEFAARELALADGAGEVIDFVVSVPAGTPPGEYITSLVAENAEPYRDTEQGGVEVDQVNRIAVAIAIEVPGARDAELAIGAVAHMSAVDTSVVTFEVINAGASHLRPSGEFILRGVDGAEIAVVEMAMDTVYAGTETLLEVSLAHPLAPGDYCADLRLADHAAQVTATAVCLRFAVPVSEGAGVGELPPVLRPIVESVVDNPLPSGLAALAIASAVGAGLYAWRRRRGGRIQRVSPGDGWPPSDPLDAAPALTRRLSPVIEGTLTSPLRNVPEVHRAWLMRHDSYLELVVEMAAGTGIAHGSSVAQSLRSRIGDLVEGVPLRVVVLDGGGIIARRTAGQSAVYVRDALDRSTDRPFNTEPGISR